MRKLIAAMNMTLDGFCDHTYGIADNETHQHYSDLLNSGDTILYGRTTYQLMEDYWPGVIAAPTDNHTLNDFAAAIEKIDKLVFSHTLQNIGWKNARLATRSLEAEVSDLKQQPGRDILVGSPGLIAAATNLRLIDEYQIAIHPVIAGRGLPLFKNISDQLALKLLKTKTFGCGVVLFYYAVV